MKDSYKCAIIGCGRIASLFEDDPDRNKPCTHAGVYNKINNTELVCAVDIDKEKRKKFKTKWNVPVYDNIKDVFKNHNIDIVSICTHPKSHRLIIEDVLKYKIKGIICEKPITNNKSDAEKILTLSKETNIPILINYNRRYDEVYRYAKEIIDNKTLGDVVSIKGNYYPGTLYAGSHIIDIMIYLIGNIEITKGFITKNDEDNNTNNLDNGFVGAIKFNNNIYGLLDITSGRNYRYMGVDIHLSKGRILIEDDCEGKGTLKLYKSIKSDINSMENCKKLKLFKIKKSKKNNMVEMMFDLINSIKENKKPISNEITSINTLFTILSFYNKEEIESL